MPQLPLEEPSDALDKNATVIYLSCSANAPKRHIANALRGVPGDGDLERRLWRPMQPNPMRWEEPALPKWTQPMVQVLLALIFLALLPAGAEAQNRRGAVDTQARNFKDCPVCPEMVTVPAGEFMMGSPESERARNKDEGPQHRVGIAQPFAVGKYEVTFSEWDACVAEGGCTNKPGDEGWGRGRHPVINVSWHDALQYTAWLTKKTGKPYRLLTEAEWEYAARGTTKLSDPVTPFSTGATINYRQANYDANFVYPPGQQGLYRQKTLDVGSFPRNSFGLHDMHGNVWEWVQDCYRPSYEGAPADGSAVMFENCELHILRGGAWNYYPKLLRSAYRYATAPEVRLNNAGFRVARGL